MPSPTLYSGPGQVAASFQGTTYVLQADGENGAIKLDLMEKRTRRSSGMFGYHKSTLEDQMAKISLTPFDSWALLPYLFPPYLGITTAGGTTSAFLNGIRPHDYAAGTAGAVSANGKAATTIWTPDGRLYSVVRTAPTKPPGMKLGVGQPLFTAMEIVGLADAAVALGASGAIITANAITESGGSNNAGAGSAPAYGVPDFINGHWTGAWGSITGFTALDPEDGWTLDMQAKFSPLTVQKRTYHYKLDSVEVIVKGRLTGPTHTQLAGKILAHTLGGVLTEGSATDLVLTGPSSKTITLKDCEVFLEGAGFEFGGTKLGTGEVAFVTQADFTNGVPGPFLEFSA